MEDCTTCTNTTEIFDGVFRCNIDLVTITEDNKLIGRICSEHSRHKETPPTGHA